MTMDSHEPTTTTSHDNGYKWISAVLPILNVTVVVYLGFVALEFCGSRLIRWYKEFKFFQSLPSLQYSPLFGNLHLMPKDGEERIALVSSAMEELHPKFLVFWMTPITPHVIVYHPDTLRAITTSSAAIKPRGSLEGYELFVPWIGEGILITNGKAWSRPRKLLNPAFHANILKNYMTVFNQCVDRLFVKLDKLAETGESFDVFPLITKCTLEIIMKCILGYDADVINHKDGDHPYAKAVHEISRATWRRFWNPLHWPSFVFERTSYGQKSLKYCDYIHKVAEEIIDKRVKIMENGEIPDSKHMEFIDILLSARDEDGQPMTPLEIRNQVDTFMFAGHDTTASSVSFALYNMAKHQDYQRKVQDEVDAVMEGRESDEILLDDLSKLKMLALCSKENLRLFPSAPVVGRVLTRDVCICDGVTLPKGTHIHLGIGHLHRNPAVWEKPHEYIPERFLNDDRDKFAYMPFSAGQRNCIGQNFAKMEDLAVLSRILHRYELQLAPGYEKPKRTEVIVLRSENGVCLTLKKRRSGVNTSPDVLAPEPEETVYCGSNRRESQG